MITKKNKSNFFHIGKEILRVLKLGVFFFLL